MLLLLLLMSQLHCGTQHHLSCAVVCCAVLFLQVAFTRPIYFCSSPYFTEFVSAVLCCAVLLAGCIHH